MIFTEINKKNKEITILVSALDWGLGHATRCIPIIKELQTLHFNIIIAASGSTENLLKKEFPHLLFLHCPKYDIRYSRKKYWLPAKLLYQVPKIVLTIIKEQFWLKKVVKKHHLGAIISDNRPGLYHSKVYSVYITHQLLIKTGNSFTEKIAQKIHYWFIKKYNACWIPDFEGKANLAGDLSHPLRPLPNTRYLGCLSRFSKTSGIEKTIDLLLLISGPEPQRSIFETILISQAKRLDGNILIVRGLPGMDAREIDTTKENGFSGEIQIQNHLPSDELNIALQQSKLVVCRSGYTSVMDFIKLQQKAILVPTPGQTEQEYLAAHLLEQKIFFTTSQHNFQLSKAIQQAEEFPYLFPCFDMEMFKTHLKQFAQSI